jgi:hypothetical protein
MTDRASNMLATEYILGLSGQRRRRLIHQAAILLPITERLLRGAGILPGHAGSSVAFPDLPVNAPGARTCLDKKKRGALWPGIPQ